MLLCSSPKNTLPLPERTGVARELQHVVNELVSQQPEDPLSYIAKQYPLCRPLVPRTRPDHTLARELCAVVIPYQVSRVTHVEASPYLTPNKSFSLCSSFIDIPVVVATLLFLDSSETLSALLSQQGILLPLRWSSYGRRRPQAKLPPWMPQSTGRLSCYQNAMVEICIRYM